MSDISMLKKWDNIYKDKQAIVKAPSRVLLENRHLLPASGVALELACGLGANALCLAENGLQTHAWDISGEAIKRLQDVSKKEKLAVIAEVRDAIKDPPAPQSFDVIVVSHFLERALFPFLIDALKPQGVLFYQTFTQERVDDSGPRNNNYRLANNELLTLCSELSVLVYREEGTVGKTLQGWRNLALVIGRKKV